MAGTMKGWVPSAATRALWSQQRRGRAGTRHTPETRAKISAAKRDPDRTTLGAQELQRCGDCREVLPFAAFYKNASREFSITARCRSCIKTGPAYRDSRTAFAGQMRRLCGLTVEEWARAFHAQEGRCAVCRDVLDDSRVNGLHTDHCHASGQFRGLLCGGCNTAAGSLRDRPDVARALAVYLEAR